MLVWINILEICFYLVFKNLCETTAIEFKQLPNILRLTTNTIQAIDKYHCNLPRG